MADSPAARPSDTQKAWYLIYTKPRQERYARENLERQGYEVYLPLMKDRRRRKGRYVEIVDALFPRYLFIHLDQDTDNWSPIRSTFGVSGLVYFGFKPARVASDFVALPTLAGRCAAVARICRRLSFPKVTGSASSMGR